MYVELLDAHIGLLHPALVQLVKQCLHNVPRQRPDTDELLTRLQRMKVEVEGEYGGPIKLDMVRVRLAKEVKMKERRIEELTRQQVMDHVCVQWTFKIVDMLGTSLCRFFRNICIAGLRVIMYRVGSNDRGISPPPPPIPFVGLYLSLYLLESPCESGTLPASSGPFADKMPTCTQAY